MPNQRQVKPILEIFWRFFLLGCASFGGPAAHLGYFRRVFVEQLQWLEEKAYARLIALGQFLPGPGSSQVGFAIGCHRGGLTGGIAAFIGFTAPSFFLMYFLAVGSSGMHDEKWFVGIVHGLKLLAVVVVTDATTTMFKSFCKSSLHRTIFVATVIALILAKSVVTQFAALGIAAVIGMLNSRQDETEEQPEGKTGLVPLLLFAGLFIVLPFLSKQSPGFGLFADFYHSGSLVFGGGHVVLPLLQSQLGDAIEPDRFLTGYAAAQGVPGPMFALATFLGVELSPDARFAGALIATLGIFVPGFLLVLGLRGTWEKLAAKPRLAGAVAGINAAVVGLLGAAAYDPVLMGAYRLPIDLVPVLLGFIALKFLKMPIIALVVAFVLVGSFL